MINVMVLLVAIAASVVAMYGLLAGMGILREVVGGKIELDTAQHALLPKLMITTGGLAIASFCDTWLCWDLHVGHPWKWLLVGLVSTVMYLIIADYQLRPKLRE